MHEKTLRDFFLDRTSAEALSRDLDGSIVMKGKNEAGIKLSLLGDGNFELTPEHLLRICDAVKKGVIEPWKLEAIGFCLVASDYFEWDAEVPEQARVNEVIHLWAAPQVNYPLTVKNVSKAARFLATGENTFTSDDLRDVPEKEWKVGRVSSILNGDLD